jgi:hypothetical protein
MFQFLAWRFNVLLAEITFILTLFKGFCIVVSLIKCKKQYLLKIQVSRLQPSAPSSISFSDPTFVLRYLCQAKSHSSWPPTLIAVQYTTFFRLAEMLFKQRSYIHKRLFHTLWKDMLIWLEQRSAKHLITTGHTAYACIYYRQYEIIMMSWTENKNVSLWLKQYSC